MNRPIRPKSWLLSKKFGMGRGTPFAERIQKIVLDDLPYLDFFISDLIKPVWIKITSKTLSKKEWIITHALHVNYFVLCEKSFAHREEQSWCLLAGTCRWRGPSHQGGSSHSGWRGGRSTSSFRHHPGQNLSTTYLVTTLRLNFARDCKVCPL